MTLHCKDLVQESPPMLSIPVDNKLTRSCCSCVTRSTEQDFVKGLDAFIETVGIKKPLALVVQGYVLSQYGLLWAAQVCVCVWVCVCVCVCVCVEGG